MKLRVVLLLFVSLSTKASIFFAPMVGTENAFQHYEIDNDSSLMIADETSFRTNGITYGLKLGWYFLPSLGVGLDYRKSSLKGSGQGVYYSETDINRELEQSVLFSTLYYKPISSFPFQLWFGVALSGKQRDSGEYNFEGESKIITGKSFKIGAGYDFFHFLTLSIEVEQLKTEKSKELSQGTTSNYIYNTFYLNYPTSQGNSTNVIIGLSIDLMKIFSSHTSSSTLSSEDVEL